VQHIGVPEHDGETIANGRPCRPAEPSGFSALGIVTADGPDAAIETGECHRIAPEGPATSRVP
jgi:hypothetical protein